MFVVDAVFFVQRFELVRKLTGCFAGAEAQTATGLQTKVEQRQDLLLRCRSQVDEQIAAGNKVQVGKMTLCGTKTTILRNSGEA